MRNKWLFFVVLGLCALFTSSRPAYLALYGVGLLFIVFSWAGREVFNRVRVDRYLATPKAFPGQPVEVRVVAENPSRFPLGWLQVTAARQPNLLLLGPHRGAGLLFGRGRLELVYQVAGMRRGYYPLGGINLTGGDPIGWTGFARSIPDDGKGLIVYPRVWPLIVASRSSFLPFGRQRHWLRAYEDPSRIGGIRDYTAGDSLRRVHWPATARLGRLQIKELIPTVSSEVWIFLDLAEGDYPPRKAVELSETAIETAASLLVHFHQQGTAVGLVSNGSLPNMGDKTIFIPAGTGAETAEAILTTLAGIRLTGRGDFLSLPATFGEAVPRGGAIFLLAPSWPEEMTKIALVLKRQGREVYPLFLGRIKDGLGALAAGLPLAVIRRHPATGGVVIRRV